MSTRSLAPKIVPLYTYCTSSKVDIILFLWIYFFPAGNQVQAVGGGGFGGKMIFWDAGPSTSSAALIHTLYLSGNKTNSMLFRLWQRSWSVLPSLLFALGYPYIPCGYGWKRHGLKPFCRGEFQGVLVARLQQRLGLSLGAINRPHRMNHERGGSLNNKATPTIRTVSTHKHSCELEYNCNIISPLWGV